MVTDSIYALVAPYLWIYNAIVIDKPKQLYSFFDVALQLFMLMNTIFSVFLLYTLSFFQRISQKPTPKRKTSQDDSSFFDDALLNKSDNEPLRKSDVAMEEALMDLYIGLRKQNATQANIVEQERQFDSRVSLIR